MVLLGCKTQEQAVGSSRPGLGKPPGGGEGGGYSGFQVKGIIEGFFLRFKIFDSGIFLGRYILQIIFCVQLI